MVRVVLLRDQPLVHPAVGPAGRGHPAIGPRLPRDPVDQVASILRVVVPRIEDPLGVVAAAHVHGHVGIPPRDVGPRLVHRVVAVVVVRGEREHSGLAPRVRRPIQVRRQHDPVPHGYLDIVFHDHGVVEERTLGLDRHGKAAQAPQQASRDRWNQRFSFWHHSFPRGFRARGPSAGDTRIARHPQQERSDLSKTNGYKNQYTREYGRIRPG